MEKLILNCQHKAQDTLEVYDLQEPPGQIVFILTDSDSSTDYEIVLNREQVVQIFTHLKIEPEVNEITKAGINQAIKLLKTLRDDLD